MVVAFNRHPRW
jgi:hypothetical protein